VDTWFPGIQFLPIFRADLEQYDAKVTQLWEGQFEITFMTESGYLAFCLRWS
jgi:hypothetical protein